MRSCPHCNNQLAVMMVCRRCLTEVDPFPTWILAAILAGTFIIGLLIGGAAAL